MSSEPNEKFELFGPTISGVTVVLFRLLYLRLGDLLLKQNFVEKSLTIKIRFHRIRRVASVLRWVMLRTISRA